MALAGLLGGCAQLVPQTMDLRTSWPQGVSRSTELSSVPFFPQTEYQCGPAAMATVLSHTGVAVTPDPLVDQIYLPSRQGSLQVEMLAAPRRWGRIGYLLAPRYSDVLREVEAGNPVVVLQDIGHLFTEWHYAVLTGFDYAKGDLYLRSGTERRLVMPFTAFERTWLKSGYWAMVVTPPERIPVTATERGWLQAVIATERAGNPQVTIAGYRAALERWPDNLPAAIGLANQHHLQGDLRQSADVLRATLRKHPDSTVAMNNLAQTLSDQGLHKEALEQIDRALKLNGPFESEVLATRELVMDRMAQQASSNSKPR